MNIESKRIIKVLIAMGVLFMSLVIYLSYFEIFRAAKVVTNNYNKRQWLNEEYVLRGKIVDRNGKILAYSEKQEDKQYRKYPFKNSYSHIIGYSSKEYGKAGLEASYNRQLLNSRTANPIQEIQEKINGPKENGNNLILTIDHELQQQAYQALKGHKGSIVLMNPKTGEVYVMASKPDFNPNTLKEDWEEIVENTDSPLLNRATMGLYTPGSIFKLVTTVAALKNPEINTEYECKGSTKIEGYVLRDYKEIAHGNVDLEEALVESCNVAFSEIGLQLGDEQLKNAAERFMFNQEIPFDLMTKSSIFPYKGNMSKPELGASAIGQGKILVTPLNMAMMASAVANEGLLMKPILVKEVLSPEGNTIRTMKIESLSRISNDAMANQVRDMMVQVVREGTGTNARIKNVGVAGKTGTAENETGKEHAWFVGFAPADNPKVAVAIVLENIGSTGGKSAAPIARDMILKTLNKLK